MTQTNFRALCAELVDELNYHADEHSVDELMQRARTALATSPPEDNTKPGFINVCVEGPPPAPYENWEDWLVDTFKNRTIKGVCIRALISGDFSFDKKEAATPPPEPPTDQEIQEWIDAKLGAYQGDPESFGWGWRCFHVEAFAVTIRAALERWGR